MDQEEDYIRENPQCYESFSIIMIMLSDSILILIYCTASVLLFFLLFDLRIFSSKLIIIQ